MALVGVAGWLVGVNVLKQLTSWSGVLLAVGATLLAAGAAAAYVRLPPARQFLRFGSAALPAFVALFLFASPVADLLWEDVGVAAGADGDRSPPIVMVVLDELPLASIVDSSGRLDAEAYPGLARLAGATTWYRNTTAVSGTTWYSVPSALSGQFPTNRLPTVADWPDNLFTLVGDDYSFEVQEAITGLCPLERCPRQGGGRLRGALGRGLDVYGQVVSPSGSTGDPQATFVEEGDTPDVEFDAFEKTQPTRFAQFIDRLGSARGACGPLPAPPAAPHAVAAAAVGPELRRTRAGARSGRGSVDLELELGPPSRPASDTSSRPVTSTGWSAT